MGVSRGNNGIFVVANRCYTQEPWSPRSSNGLDSRRTWCHVGKRAGPAEADASQWRVQSDDRSKIRRDGWPLAESMSHNYTAHRMSNDVDIGTALGHIRVPIPKPLTRAAGAVDRVVGVGPSVIRLKVLYEIYVDVEVRTYFVGASFVTENAPLGRRNYAKDVLEH